MNRLNGYHPTTTFGESMVEQKKFDERGSLVQLWHEVDGIFHGSLKTWSGDGVLIYETNFEHGKQHGEARVWNEHGVLIRVCHFENGELHGHYWSSWENGKIKEEGEYQHGKRVTPYTWYDQEGGVIQSV
jgi:antitoxin component YwqK of YwqJK toxin-antitoxin module